MFCVNWHKTHNSLAIQDDNTKPVLHYDEGNDARHLYKLTFFLQRNPK